MKVSAKNVKCSGRRPMHRTHPALAEFGGDLARGSMNSQVHDIHFPFNGTFSFNSVNQWLISFRCARREEV